MLVVFVLGMLLVLQYVSVVVVLNVQANASLSLRRARGLAEAGKYHVYPCVIMVNCLLFRCELLV